MPAGARELAAGSLGALARTLERAAAASTYLAAGLLHSDALTRHTAENWRRFGLAQSEADVAEGLFGWEERFYARCMTPGERVLVVGCGSGRDLLALLRLGYRADGLEPVGACVQLARARLAAAGLTARVHVAEVTTATLTESYDVVLFSWFCYSYLPGRARRLAALHAVRRHLAPGGRIVVSYILALPGARTLPVRLAQLTARLSRSDWRPEPGDVFLRRADTGYIHYEHRFRPDEIEAEMRQAGLVVTCHEQDGDGNLAARIADTAVP
jgi:SAM-dependent methyltransferase